MNARSAASSWRPATVVRFIALLTHGAMALPPIGVVDLALLVLLGVGDRGVDSMAGLFFVPALAVAVPTLGFVWLIRRWLRTGQWWVLAAVDLAVAVIGVLGVLLAPQPPSFAAIAIGLGAAATLAAVSAMDGGAHTPRIGPPARPT
jgi:hypothetical protein